MRVGMLVTASDAHQPVHLSGGMYTLCRVMCGALLKPAPESQPDVAGSGGRDALECGGVLYYVAADSGLL